MQAATMLAFFTPGPMEMIIIGAVAVLLFGKRLPEVGRSVGKGLMEFKKGVRGITSEIEDSVNDSTPTRRKSSSSSSRYSDIDDREEATAPKFEPPAEDSPADDSPANRAPSEETPA